MRLNFLVSYTLKFYELLCLSARVEAWYFAVWYPIWPSSAFGTEHRPRPSKWYSDRRNHRIHPLVVMKLNTVNTFIEITEFCHKIRSFRDDDENNSSLNHSHCRNDIFVQKCCYKFLLLFRRTGCKFSPHKNNSFMLWLSLYLEFSAIWMEYILTIFLARYFKNTATFKLSHEALDIAWNVTKSQETRNNTWQKRSGLKCELGVLY